MARGGWKMMGERVPPSAELYSRYTSPGLARSCLPTTARAADVAVAPGGARNLADVVSPGVRRRQILQGVLQTHKLQVNRLSGLSRELVEFTAQPAMLADPQLVPFGLRVVDG